MKAKRVGFYTTDGIMLMLFIAMAVITHPFVSIFLASLGRKEIMRQGLG